MKILPILSLILILAACSNTFYIVRHAEKEGASTGTTMSTPDDPVLSAAGERRAEQLKEKLRDKNIRYIFSTQTRRTELTAAPIQKLTSLNINYYNTDTIENFITRLKAIKTGNVLVIGHSNTVDDIVNTITGEINIPGDLKDSDYDNLFVIKRQGNKFRFIGKKYGE